MYRKKITAGYREVFAYYDERLKYCPNGSCGVVYHTDGAYSLMSYQSIIITVEPANDEVVFTNLVDCSATTRKHVGCFLREYLPTLTYQDAKRLKGYALNLDTGEIKKWDE